jgi:SAM-dependent methyltransferase
MSYHELLLGCGHQRKKLLAPNQEARDWQNLTTLDINPDCKPDIICDLTSLPWEFMHIDIVNDTVMDHVEKSDYKEDTDDTYYMLKSDYFDEIHAYEVLEHIGRQGNLHLFFGHFTEIWRMLKPGGLLCATTPSRYSEWLWGDPGHTRVILPSSLVFLDQTKYAEQAGRTALSDYRHLYRADFKVMYVEDDKVFNKFVLQAVKPPRIP